MTLRWLNYLLPRLLLGTALSIFAVYGGLFILNERFFADKGGLFPLITLAITILTFIVAWFFWTSVGRLQLKRLLKKAAIAEEERNYIEGEKRFKKASSLINSSHLSPKENSWEKQDFIAKYAQFLSGGGRNNDEALAIYERYLKFYPSDETFMQRIVPLMMTSDYIEKDNLPFLHKLQQAVPDFADYTNFLAKQYLNLEIYNVESQEAMLNAIRADSTMKEHCLKFLLPRMIEQGRTDPKALEVYIEAFYLNITHRELKPLLGRIAEKARYEENPGPLSSAIIKIFDSLPKNEREEIKITLRLERLTKIPVEGEKVEDKAKADQADQFDEEVVYKPSFSIINFLEKAAGLFITIISLLLNGIIGVINFVIKRWNVIRWVLGAAMAVIIGFGLIKVMFTEKPSSEQVSLEVISDLPFTIQIAAFKDPIRAENAIRKLEIPGMKPYLVIAGENPTWYQIRLGHFSSRAEAQKTADSLKAQRFISDYFIANFLPGTYLE